jgi:microcystin-dependent protein
MGGFKHTNVNDATVLTEYLTANQAVNCSANYLSSVSGGDTISASGTFSIAAYAAGQRFVWIAAADNTTAATLNVSGLGAKNLYKKSSGGLVALVAKDLISGQVYSAIYDGTQFVLDSQRAYSQGADIASAGTVNLDTATGDYLSVTGTTTVTAITLSQGEQRVVKFTGILTLTNGASLILPGAANITTAANDIAVFRGEASGVVRCVQYTKADGTAVSGLAQQPGEICFFARNTAPTGFLKANGATISRTTYAALFAALYKSSTVTITIASPGVITWTGHGLSANDPVQFTSTGALPTGFVTATTYYVVSASITTNTFQLSATAGGAAINTSGTQSGFHTAINAPFGIGDGSTTFGIPDMRSEHPRGWDDSRGVDVARVFGSAQLDAMQGHIHQYSYIANLTGGASGPNLSGSGNTGSVSGPVTDGTNGTPRTASETRGRNVALLACIKY